ncbi:MAG: hypothetical protein ABIK56_02735 [candidate division WOR-3 bacterium]
MELSFKKRDKKTQIINKSPGKLIYQEKVIMIFILNKEKWH